MERDDLVSREYSVKGNREIFTSLMSEDEITME